MLASEFRAIAVYADTVGGLTELYIHFISNLTEISITGAIEMAGLYASGVGDTESHMGYVTRLVEVLLYEAMYISAIYVELVYNLPPPDDIYVEPQPKPTPYKFEGAWHWYWRGMELPYFVFEPGGRGMMSDAHIRWWARDGVLFLCITPDTCDHNWCTAPIGWYYAIDGDRLTLTMRLIPDVYHIYFRR